MNKHKATILLIIVTLGFLIAYPFHRTFWGGLLSSAFCASMIGGFADWYGITALFHKPLGISYKTEIVPRNRDKIINALCNMVTEDLITKDSLNKFAGEYNFSEIIISYIRKNKDDENFKNAVFSLIYRIIDVRDEESLEVISKLLKENLTKISLWSIIKSSIETSIKSGYDEKILDFIIDELIIFSKSDDFFSILKDMATTTKTSYENGMARRKFVNNFVLDILLQTSPEDIAKSIQQRILGYLVRAKNPSSDSRKSLKIWLYSKFDEYKNNAKLIKLVEDWKFSKLKSLLDKDKLIIYLDKISADSLNEGGNLDKLSVVLYNQFINLSDTFENTPNWQRIVNEGLRSLSYSIIEIAHNNLKNIIKDNLSSYSNDELIELIESKAGDDLQLIRINGSIVGGFVGILAFFFNSIPF